MNDQQGQNITMLLRNANKFLWGISNRNQKETYIWLKEKDFLDKPKGAKFGVQFTKSYDDTLEKLLETYGIEKIMTDLVKPRVYEILSEPLMNSLRQCWQNGVRPTVDTIKMSGREYILTEKARTKWHDEPDSFLIYNTQFNYIEGYGQLGYIWFEVIEPWLKEVEAQK